jgi:hypothetical protein
MNAKIRRTIEQTALHEGALRIEWADGQNHHLVRFYMPSGLVVSMPVSKGSRIDEYKYKGWTRQYIRNPSKWHVRVPPA